MSEPTMRKPQWNYCCLLLPDCYCCCLSATASLLLPVYSQLTTTAILFSTACRQLHQFVDDVLLPLVLQQGGGGSGGGGGGGSRLSLTLMAHMARNWFRSQPDLLTHYRPHLTHFLACSYWGPALPAGLLRCK